MIQRALEQVKGTSMAIAERQLLNGSSTLLERLANVQSALRAFEAHLENSLVVAVIAFGIWTFSFSLSAKCRTEFNTTVEVGGGGRADHKTGCHRQGDCGFEGFGRNNTLVEYNTLPFIASGNPCPAATNGDASAPNNGTIGFAL